MTTQAGTTTPTTPSTPATTKYHLKFLNHNRMPAHGGVGQWPEPGIWTDLREPIPCEQGWHLCRKRDIFHWVHKTLWVAEVRGEPVIHPEEDNKVVARRARLVRQVEEWNPKTQRLFAADCAERVLHHWESAYPNDDRPRKAIETARRFAGGDGWELELIYARDASWAAATGYKGSAWSTWSAAEHAARAAARTAAESVERRFAEYAARDAANYACYAARFAAGDVGVTTERNWQINHLFAEYLKLDPDDFH